MARGDQKLWPDVTSPLARRILGYLFNLPASYTDNDFTRRITVIEKDLKYKGLRDLWARIQGSDIGIRLAKGPEYLPDISEHMPPTARQIYRLLRPRTLEQLIHSVAMNLEWYISPHTEKPRVLGYVTWPMIVILTLVDCGLHWLGDHFTGPGQIPFTLGKVLLLIIIIRMVFLYLSALLTEDLYTYKTRITVLYQYLRGEFGETDSLNQ